MSTPQNHPKVVVDGPSNHSQEAGPCQQPPQEQGQQTLKEEPKPSEDMKVEKQQDNDNQLLQPKPSRGSSSSDSSVDTDVSDMSLVSGYHRKDGDECTEFCTECCLCFGVVDCCPRSGAGCLTSVATFIGNLLFGCCKR
ncbi:uncharacterized protein LODBEIA_P51850 [Lodderomyces beijingensis]|uniref:Cysteine-rich transmembrane CYSTM domain-containing protein n=1 Tax=Lodderomyces beijingensis TaxID=1775926 RepID=A0ABP0ZS53_9ASCO